MRESMMKPVTIVGGGIAGLTLGIGLRQRGVPVTLWEAGRYPRHKVCGEFISGRGQETIRRLGLDRVLDEAGATRARTAAFFSEKRSTPAKELPSEAICLSRFQMDEALAAEFRKLDGELREGSRWQDYETVVEGIVRATGRRVHTEPDRDRWFGLKIHVKASTSNCADLELHLVPDGYVGLCRINGGAMNVCGLFRQRGNGEKPSQVRELLFGKPGSILRGRFKNAEFDDKSFCAVAGLSLLPQRAGIKPHLNLGDAITMIPPATGNGMSMAFESAEIAIEPVMAWSQGKASWAQAMQMIASSCDRAFRKRLFWAKWLQRAMLNPILQSVVLLVLARSEVMWRMTVNKTR